MNEQEAIKAYMKRRGITRIRPTAALIDMDGTLYDSMGNHADAWYRLISGIGIECTRDEFFLYEGRTGVSTINLLFNRAYGHDAAPEEAKELYHKKTLYFSDMPPVSPMPGAKEMVNTFLSNNITTVLVTGSGQNTLLNRLDTDYPGAFPTERRITSHDVKRGKPDPEPFIKAMTIVNASPEECIAVDNAPLGVKSGAATGAFTIGVTTGPIPREELSKAGADIVYSSMTELAQRLPILISIILQTGK